MRLVPSKITVLANAMDICKELLHDGVLSITKQGIGMQGMDSSHVAFIDFYLNKQEFEEYAVDRAVNLGVHMGSLHKLLKLGATMDKCVISQPSDDELHFEFSGKNKEMRIDLSLMDIEGDSMFTAQEFDYSTIFEIASTELSSMCKDFSMFSDQVKITKGNDGVLFSTASDTTNFKNTEMVLKPDFTKEITGDVEGLYALKYLNTFSKAATLNQKVEISVGKDYPLKLHYGLGPGSYLDFYLAPRIVD